MAVKRSARATARKVKDKWRSKEWYRILAPDMFNNTQIAETMSDDPSKIIGRVTEVTMQDITGDFSKMHIKLQFKINEVNGSDAHTQFIGHSLTSDYIRRLTRRKHSKTDGVFDVVTKDKSMIRVKPMAVTEKRIQISQQQAIRSKIGKIIREEAGKNMSSEFIKEMLSGNVSKTALRACKTIYPLKRIEIRRSEVVRLPTDKVVEAPVEAPEQTEDEPTEADMEKEETAAEEELTEADREEKGTDAEEKLTEGDLEGEDTESEEVLEVEELKEALEDMGEDAEGEEGASEESLEDLDEIDEEEDEEK